MALVIALLGPANRARDTSLAHRLPLADAIVLATARAAAATLWTQDKDFEGLPRVRFHAKRRARG